MSQSLYRIILAGVFTASGISIAQGQSISERIGSAVQNFGSQTNNMGGQYFNGNHQHSWQEAIQGIGQNLGNQWKDAIGSQWPPQTIVPPVIVHPPQPQPCHYYIVYYYDQNHGWQKLATYRSQTQANYAVQSLQSQGYRTYVRRVNQSQHRQSLSNND